jgi:hypothetical protein
LSIGWAPAGSEAGKKVKWQMDIAFMHVGHDASAIDFTATVEDDCPVVAASYAHSLIQIPSALIPTETDELHARIQRITSSNDPTLPPGLHHLAVIQFLP